jgi:hypothetical protein
MHLTYPNSDTHTGAVSTANAGEAGAPGIEVTQEMIEAGVYILRNSGRLERPASSDGLVVKDIISAAIRARRLSQSRESV